MLLLPAAALCCLCSALVSTATELIQDDLTLTRRVSEKVSFSCGGTDQCSNSYVYWYQKKESETFTVILDINRNSGALDKRYNHPQKDDFSAVNKGNGCELQIQRVKLSHSASYFCSCWYSGLQWYRIFGSGTKLFVTDHEVLEPMVSLYSVACRDQQEKSPLLYVASAMFPPLVQISWKRQKDNGPLEEVPPAEGEQLEIRESGRTSSILLIKHGLYSYKYVCSVEHEGGTVEALTEDDPFRSECRVRLLTLLYSVLIVKSLVYCCGLCLLRILTNNTPSILCSCAN
ncbi:uncharacterized protein LOC121520418 [Cheilinus undulatus]|uniref:uncharacterized protein LOC121520418 n=1 Tax=Cheilinus undulatus TaxID=241271 RepID=UPI001BD48A14|nr:uncharacterized protein LOC121520418 [Cheilinus undulatus]